MDIGELVIRIVADLKGLEAGLNKAKSDVAAFGSGAAAGISSTMKSVQEQMHHTGMAFMKAGMDAQMAGMNMTMAVAPVVAALGLATKGAGDFATDLNKLKVVAGGTSEEITLAKTIISDLSKTYGVSVGDMTKVATDFAAIGFSMKDSLELTRQAALLATSGLGTTEQATTLLTQAVSQFNLPVSEAARLTDVFSYVANATSANVSGLSTSFGYVGTTAKQLGMSVNETAAVLGIIQNSLQDASMSGTGFRMILQSLINPSKEAAEMMQQYGIVIRDGAGNMLPFATIVDNVKAAVGGLDAAERDLALSTMFDVRGMSAMAALMTTGTDKIRELTKGTEQQGYAAGVAKDMLGSFGAQVSQLRQQIEEVAREVGETLLPVLQEMMVELKDALPAIKEIAKSFAENLIPVLKTLFETGMKLIAWFNDLSPEMKGLIAKVAAVGVAFAAVAGPILLFGGMVAGAIGNLLMIGSTLMGLISGPIGLVILAVAALALAWTTNFGGIQEKMQPIIEKISTLISVMVNFVSAEFDRIRIWWDENGTLIMNAVSNVMDFMIFVFNIIVGVVAWAMPYISSVISGSISIILDIIKLFAQILTGDWRGAFDTIINILSTAFDVIKTVLTMGLDAIKTAFTKLVGSAFDWGKNLITGFVDGIKSMLGSVANVGADIANTIAGYIGIHSPAEKGPLSRLTEWGPNLVKTYAEGITRNMNLLDATFMRMGSPQFGAAGAGIGSGKSISLVMNSTYNITGTSNTTDLKAALERHDKDLLREIERKVM